MLLPPKDVDNTLIFFSWARGDAKDYNRWSSRWGCSGWSWDEVLPYFRRMESWRGIEHSSRGINGPIHIRPSNKYAGPLTVWVLEALAAVGIPYVEDYNRGRTVGSALVQATIAPSGSRVSSASAYVRPYLKTRLNLHVRTSAHVTRVVFKDKTAHSVECKQTATILMLNI